MSQEILIMTKHPVCEKSSMTENTIGNFIEIIDKIKTSSRHTNHGS